MAGIVAASALLVSDRTAWSQVDNRAGGSSQRSERDGSRGTNSLVVTDWQVVPQILSSVPAVIGDAFGSSAAMNEGGTILVVGASDATVDGSPATGAVHIFEYSDALHAWEHKQRLECPPKVFNGAVVGPAGLALFGWSVSVSDTTIVVGAPVATLSFGPQLGGRAYVFQRNAIDGLWGNPLESELGVVRVANKIIGPTDPEMIGFFGASVAVDVVGVGDTRIVVGSPYKGAANTGGVYVFEGSGNTFSQKAFLVPADVVAQDNFGTKVAIDGTALVVGSQLSDIDDLLNVGVAHVYRRSVTAGVVSWSTTPEAILFRADGESGDGFGSAVSIIGNTIAIGAPGTDLDADGITRSSNNGSAFVYRLTAGIWQFEQEVFARESNGNNAFGYSLGLADGGNLLIVGAPGYETGTDAPNGGVNAGAGFSFERGGVNPVWAMQSSDLWARNALANQGIGEQVAVSGDGLKATLGSRHNVSGGPFSTAIASNLFGWTSDVDALAGVTVSIGDRATTPDAPGPSGYPVGTNTQGTGVGGESPSTGGFGSPAVAVPAMPTIEEWGVVQASIIAVDRANSRISIILTDGNGELETAAESKYFLGDFDPAWQVLGLGDVNGDKSSDIFFLVPQNNGKAKVKAWIRVGHEILETVTVGTASVGDRFMGISDWRGNGFDGPAFLHADGKNAAFWMIQGGALSEKVEWELGEGNWTFKTTELTGDEIPDLLVRDAAANKLFRVVPGANNEAATTFVNITNPGPNWRLAASHDFDGNGSGDFLWEESDSGKLQFYFPNADGSIRFTTPWDSNLKGWKIDSGANFAQGGTTGLIFSKGNEEVLILKVRWEALETLPAGRGNIRVDYTRGLGALDKGYTVLGPAEEP